MAKVHRNIHSTDFPFSASPPSHRPSRRFPSSRFPHSNAQHPSGPRICAKAKSEPYSAFLFYGRLSTADVALALDTAWVLVGAIMVFFMQVRARKCIHWGRREGDRNLTVVDLSWVHAGGGFSLVVPDRVGRLRTASALLPIDRPSLGATAIPRRTNIICHSHSSTYGVLALTRRSSQQAK